MEYLDEYPLSLPKHVDLLRNPYGQPQPLIVQGLLRLLACRISGISMLQAVSMTHKNIEAAPIGQHPLVSRLVSTIQDLPYIPQYCSTWDVAAVFSWLKNQGFVLKRVIGKLVLLMALVSANRTSELHALNL